jgi:hypothetical protein
LHQRPIGTVASLPGRDAAQGQFIGNGSEVESFQFRFVPTALALENIMSDQIDAQNQPQSGASDPGTAAGDASVSVIERKLMNIAEELGTWLGTAERKTTDFLAQQDLKESLVKIRDTAARLLAQVEKGRERSR